MFRGRWRLRDEIGFNEDTFGEKVLERSFPPEVPPRISNMATHAVCGSEATINSKNLLAGPEGVKIQHNGTAIH